MYRYGQGTNSRSNGIYCEPETSHLSSPPPHGTKKGKSRHHHRHRTATSSRGGGHLPQSEADSSDGSEGTYQDSSDAHHHHHQHQHRLNLNHQSNGGADSPPEPAPSDLPLRMNGGLRSLKPFGGELEDSDLSGYGHHVQPGAPGLYLPQEYMMSSPYQSKPMGTSLATAKKLFQSDNLQNETADSNSTLSTLPSQARLLGGLGPPASNPVLTGIPQAPVILPVFPNSHAGVTGPNGTSRSLQRGQYSPSRFTLQKDCHVSDRCSWKCISIALILLCIALISILIYTAAIMGNCSRYSGAGCILVEDAKVLARGEKSFPVIDLTSMSPKTSEDSPTTSLPPELSSRDFSSLQEGLSPQELLWGSPLFRKIEPYSFWTLEVKVRESGYLNLNLSFPWGSNLALLFRKNTLPSITQHDIVKLVKDGRVEHRNKRRHVRSITNTTSTTSSSVRGRRDALADQNVALLSEFLEGGKWFLRIFNDDLFDRRVGLVAATEPATEARCPLQCSGNGNCLHGKCHCLDGYSGVDCSNSICPVLCSNHGRYSGGLCHCEGGWKGPECDVPESECEVGNCNGNGDCVAGKCVCREGWRGAACESRDCADPTCSSHGSCLDGKCSCEEGWTGALCNVPDALLAKCIPDCGGKGEFEAGAGKCICRKPFSGPTCSEVSCEKDCGRNGICSESGECECKAGWAGEGCDLLACDPRCQEHGQCKNGTCVCTLGWNGKHCTLAGCPNACSHHGSCIMQESRYLCKCSNSWAGEDCSIRLETNCSDDIDNDDDGMTDCSDSECCEDPKCKDHLMCMTASDPVEVLLRKQPPSVTSSFFQRVKFLIEENSVQSYAQKDEYSESQFWSSFDPRRVSVIRGQVLSPDGLGIIGIRVSVSDKKSRFGFTLTRKGGWFDMLVNGGGSVTLQFQRIPFAATTRTVFVPWNEIVVLDPPVIMSVGGSQGRSGEEGKEGGQEPCLQHDIRLLKPVVMSSWLPGMVGARPQDSLVFGESQILQQSIVIPGSDVHLVYQSSQSPGYLATIMMQVTGASIPPGLLLVHLKITIEGELHTQTFEADPNITYSFGWRKRNVYQQKVYGLAAARVAIGYQYASCSRPVWTVRTVTLKGFDVDIADVGGWNLDIHHHYNFHEGILQKGDGSEVHLKEMPRIVSTIMGQKGQQRSLLCEPCENLLLSPIDLATGPDGSIYVGDFNLIRRITPDNKVYTLLQLSATKVSHQYYMTISPADGHLYISDPEKYQVLRVSSMEEVIEDPRVNWAPVIGSGLKCLPGDASNCGDGFKAKLAKLIHPKGIAITMEGSMYLADGPSIRFVDGQGVIHTLVGSHGHGRLRPSLAKTTDFESCVLQREDMKKVQLQWPTNIALNLVENQLLFIDEGILFRITEDKQVERALSCDASHRVGRPILDLAFSPKGQLYFVSEDSNLFTLKREGEAVLLRTDKVFPYGANSTGHGQENNLGAGFISALSTGADGTVYVADQTNLEVKQVTSFIPLPNAIGDYEVVFPATGEIYTFNRYGQHISTRDIKSGKTLYSFLYTKNTSYGKLSKITDAAENKILFLRDYSSVVSTIENTQGKKCNLKINHLGRLVHFQEMENSEIRLEYSDEGLLVAKTSTSGLSSLFSYDHYGRVRSVIGETGVITAFDYDLVGEGIQVRVSDSSSKNHFLKYTILRDEERDQVTVSKLGSGENTLKRRVIETSVANMSFSLRTEEGAELSSLSWGLYPLLREPSPHLLLEGNLMRAPSHQTLTDGDSGGGAGGGGGGGNRQEWRFGLLGDAALAGRILDRQMWVNESRVLSLEFDPSLSREVVYSRDREPIFLIQYDNTGLPLYFLPYPQTAEPKSSMNITYDRFNRIEGWRWGPGRGVQVTYGRNGFATEIRNAEGTRLQTIDYNEYGHPAKITLGSARAYSFSYDLYGGLKGVGTPKGGEHRFSLQHSIGFTKLVYQPPGEEELKGAVVKYFNSYGLLQSLWLPNEAGRVLYEYDNLKRITATLYSEGKVGRKYKGKGHGQVTITMAEGKFESTAHIWRNGVGKVVLDKREYGAKLGLAASKLVYEYDLNFRPVLIKGRIGGNLIPDLPLAYNPKTGRREVVGIFRVSEISHNQTTMLDGTAVFSTRLDRYRQPLQYSLTIQDTEVFKMDFLYYETSHKVQTVKLTTKNGGPLPVRNYSYGVDGELVGVESAEPWKFQYDGNGNLESLAYRGNPIRLEHSEKDRILLFGEKGYKYDGAGRIIQNTKEEFFTYNALGHLKRVWKKGIFDVEYFYDHENRLIARKDSQGNSTQFLYADEDFPRQVTHIYNPRENRLLHLIYDGAGRLIYVQVNRNQRYYVASDQNGSPLIIFNQYGQVVREITRTPYGHILYDTDSNFYLPIDYCGGIYDQVTLLVHMKDGRVYDPLIGQFLTPDWESVMQNLKTPEKLHLYRLNGNDPINVHDSTPAFDHHSWLKHLGYSLDSFAPQLFPRQLGLINEKRDLVVSGLESRVQERLFDIPLLGTIPKSVVTKSTLVPDPGALICQLEPPLGKSMLLSRTSEGKAMISCPFCSNRIYRDVFTLILNGSEFLPYVSHSPSQDTFHFAKRELWKASDDLAELKRIGGQVNVTVHDQSAESEVIHVRIAMSGALISLKYGLSGSREEARLIHHAKAVAGRRAWLKVKELLTSGFPLDFSPPEKEEILKTGHLASHHHEFTHAPEEQPFFADDPLNVKLTKKGGKGRGGRAAS